MILIGESCIKWRVSNTKTRHLNHGEREILIGLNLTLMLVLKKKYFKNMKAHTTNWQHEIKWLFQFKTSAQGLKPSNRIKNTNFVIFRGIFIKRVQQEKFGRNLILKPHK